MRLVFSSLRVYAICGRNLTLAVIVGFLSIVPVAMQSVSFYLQAEIRLCHSKDKILVLQYLLSISTFFYVQDLDPYTLPLGPICLGLFDIDERLLLMSVIPYDVGLWDKYSQCRQT